MKTIICSVLFLLCTSTMAQYKAADQEDILKWAVEKISKHGQLRNDYFTTIDEIPRRSLRETQIKKDSSGQYDLAVYVGNRDIGHGREGVLVYFRLTDIACVEKNWRYDEKCITLHIDTVRAQRVTSINRVPDTTETNSWRHFKIHIMLKWSREPGLYRKLYRSLAQIAEMNKKEAADYTQLHERFDSVWVNRMH